MLKVLRFSKKIFIGILPFFIYQILKKYLSSNNSSLFTGNFNTWQDAKQLCSGYEDKLIPKKIRQAALKVKNKEAAYERDSVLFNKITYSWPLVAIITKVASQSNNSINIVDFGGSLGSTYFQNSSFFSNLNLKWNIVEQPSFVDLGRESFQTNQLQFYLNIDECLKENNSQILLLSSVLQYLDDPEKWIKKFINYNFDYILLDRTAFIKSQEHIITIQKVPSNIYEASYPAWFFNFEKLIDLFNMNYDLFIDFDTNIDPPIIVNNMQAYWKGAIFKKKHLHTSL